MHFSIHGLAYLAGVTLFLVLASYPFRKRLRVKTTSVLCPTAQMPAEVRLDSDARIQSCSRIAHLESCSQSCTPQLQFSADNLSEFVAKHEGKKCASCGRGLTADEWYKSRVTADTEMLGECHDSALSRISKTTARPLCFTCYQALGAE